MDKRIAFTTLGCKVNQYETEAIRALFEDCGYTTVEFSSEADVYLINTCTVTAEADRKSRQLISRAHKQNENAKIIVVGCYAQHAAEEIMKMPGVCLAVGTKERLDLPRLLEDAGEALNTVTPYTRHEDFELLNAVKEGRTRATLKIQDGCDRFCTYCIIPFVRGGIRSRTLEDVKAQLQSLADEGFKEVVLTGIHLMSYGRDLKDNINLLDAIKTADDIDTIQRIRLGSLEPKMLDENFVKALASNEKMCRQFHLSLQSGCDTVLKRMGRRYDSQEYFNCVKLLREAMPDCAITTDIIIGFPGETEEEFNETLEFANRVKLSKIHVFPYSRRDGTKAAQMDGQLSRKVKAERAKKLIDLSSQFEKEYASQYLNKTVSVLFERFSNGVLTGHTSTYVQVAVNAQNASGEGEIRDVLIDGVFSSPLHGVIIEK